LRPNDGLHCSNLHGMQLGLGPLASLPCEVRDQINFDVCGGGNVMNRQSARDDPRRLRASWWRTSARRRMDDIYKPCRNLLTVSHQFSREIAHTLYSRNRFIFEAQDGSSMPEPFELFCEQIPRRHKKPRHECGTRESYCWFHILGLDI